MPHKDEVDLSRTDWLDALRTKVRLQHRIAQRRELNEAEAELMKEFDKRVAEGKPFALELK